MHFKGIKFGSVDKRPLILLVPKKRIPNKPNILIMAGCHGDEPAGVITLLQMVRDNKFAKYKDCNISLLPVFNPYGVLTSKHNNKQGKNPNRGFTEEFKDELTLEGKALKTILPFLKRFSKDGFLDLHEDSATKDKCYIFGYNNKKVAENILTDMSKYFAITSNIKLTYHKVIDGIGMDVRDGSVEDYLSSTSKVCITTETPARAPLEDRIKCTETIIDSFIKLVGEGK